MNDMQVLSSPFADFLGVEIVEVTPGKSVCRLELKEQHLNSSGRVHGGILTSLADIAAGAAVRSIRPEGKTSATTDLNISFIREPRGKSIEARAELIHAGKHLFRAEMSVFSEGQLIAKTNATFMLVDESSPTS